MGIDNFLIYTNGCEDGTSEILDHLQELGVLQHRNNDDWKGNSPQQYALNQSLEEPVIKNAEWIIHIDVDEFMNVRCGNGTVQEFIAAVPDATKAASAQPRSARVFPTKQWSFKPRARASSSKGR